MGVYHEGYKAGYRAGEVDGELGSGEALGNVGFPPGGEAGLNAEAYHAAVLWGYQDGLEGNEPRAERCVEMHIDNEFAV